MQQVVSYFGSIWSLLHPIIFVYCSWFWFPLITLTLHPFSSKLSCVCLHLKFAFVCIWSCLIPIPFIWCLYFCLIMLKQNFWKCIKIIHKPEEHLVTTVNSNLGVNDAHWQESKMGFTSMLLHPALPFKAPPTKAIKSY